MSVVPKKKSTSSISSCRDFSCRCDSFEHIQMKDFQFCGGCGDNDISTFTSQSQPEHSDQEIQNLQILRSFIQKVINKDIDLKQLAKNMSIQGIFVKISDSKQFSDLIFPGTPSHILTGLPKNLKELLLWKDLEVDLLKIAKKGESILDGVKKRGRERGDIMDALTQEAILPEIVYEALAIELVDNVRLLGRKLSAVRAQVSVPEASVSSPHASLDQLESSIIYDLESNHIAVQMEFMGAEWSTLLVKDVRRFVKAEKMSEKMMVFSNDEMKRSPLTAFIEYEDIQDKYPALAEVVQQLHALPYELNAKTSSRHHLLEPVRGLTMLVWFREGNNQPLRLDNKTDSGWDSAVTITSSYHIIPDQPSAAIAEFKHTDEFKPEHQCSSIDITDDQLILFKSRQIHNMRTPAASEYFNILYFMQSKSSSI